MKRLGANVRNPRGHLASDPYVRASLAGVPYEQFIGERPLTPNSAASDVLDEDDEFVDTFGAEYYGQSMEPNPRVDEVGFEEIVTDSWLDPI